MNIGKLWWKATGRENEPDQVEIVVRYKGYGRRPELGTLTRDPDGTLWEATVRGWRLVEEDDG